MSKFYVLEGPLRGRTFEITELASIGRDDACAVRLEGKHISRIHARMEKRGDAMVIRDNGSRNGIFVNGQNVKESILRAGDEIEIGEHVLVFDPPGDPEKLPRSAARVLESLTDPFSAAEPDDRLPELLGTAASLVAMEDEKEIARALLNTLMAAVSPLRGVVMLEDAAGKHKPAARKSPSGEEEFYISNVLNHQVSEELKAVVAADVLRRQPYAGRPIGILCAPLAARKTFLGLVYLESKLPDAQARPPFRSSDLRFAAALCAFAGTRIAQVRRIASRVAVGERPLAELKLAFEKEYVVEALRETKGDLEKTAKLLGLDRPALDEKLKTFGLVAAPAGKTKPSGPVDWKSVQT